MKRRDFLYIGGSVVAVSALYGANMMGGMMGRGSMMGQGGMGNGGMMGRQKGSSNIGSLQPLKKPLAIPKLLRGKNINGIYHYNLNIGEAEHSFFKSVKTKTFAVDGTYLAPTIRLINGTNVSINYTNNLNEPTTMHGHGMHVPAKYDGGVHQVIASGAKWSAKYKVNQKACTNWYHPHLMGKTAEQVYKGLAGVIIVEDSNSKALNLPKRYGIDDIPLVLQDREFTPSGQILYAPSMHDRMMGYVSSNLICNGAFEPYFDAEAKELRLRLLNGSNAGVYYLAFSDGREFKVIAGDNSFLQNSVSLNKIRLCPAERVEIVVDLSKDFGKSLSLVELGLNKKFLDIKVSKKATAKSKTPKRLTNLDSIDLNKVKRRRSFELSAMMGQMYINGKQMDKNRVDEQIPLGEYEIWEVYSRPMMGRMGMNHNFHMHATHFRVLSRNGSRHKVLHTERGYKDVVFLAPGDKVELLVKMTDYKDAKYPYMYHCHVLEHEDMGMMGQFTVV